MADAVGDIVVGDVEDLAIVGHAAKEDVGVRMADVVMVDRDPVEASLRFDSICRMRSRVKPRRSAISAKIFRRDNEAKQVAVLASAHGKALAVSLVLESGIVPAPLAIAGRHRLVRGSAGARRPPCSPADAS